MNWFWNFELWTVTFLIIGVWHCLCDWLQLWPNQIRDTADPSLAELEPNTNCKSGQTELNPNWESAKLELNPNYNNVRTEQNLNLCCRLRFPSLVHIPSTEWADQGGEGCLGQILQSDCELEMGIEPNNKGLSSSSVRFGHCYSSVQLGFGYQTLPVHSVRFGMALEWGLRSVCSVRVWFDSHLYCRCICMVLLSPFVCPSVNPWIVTKTKYLLSKFLYHINIYSFSFLTRRIP